MSKIDIAFMADYGLSHGKGLEIEVISSECKKLDILGDIYLRKKTINQDEFTYSHQNNVLPLGSFLFRLLTAVQLKVLQSFRARHWQEKIFDFMVSTRIKKKPENKFFYGVPRLVKSFKKAKKLGYITILHAAEMSSHHNIQLLNALYKDNCPPAIWDKALLKISSETYKYVDFVIAHSEDSKNSYIKSGFDKEKVFVTPMGFHNKELDKKLVYRKEGVTKFLFIGNVTMMKGVHIIFEAWNKLDTSKAELHICGSVYEDMKDSLNKFIKSNKNVFYHGYVKPKEWFNKCDVFVFPSLSEGFSRVVIEAAASGIPVIASKPSTDKRLFIDNKNGYIINPTPEDLANKIQMIMGDFKTIEEVGRSSAEDFSSLSWDNFGRNTAEILLSITGNKINE